MRAKSQVHNEHTKGCAMSIRQYKANQLGRLEFDYVGFQTRSPIMVGLVNEKLQHVKDFL